MIANLRGRLVSKLPSRLVIDVNGVGYDVHVPVSTFYSVGDVGAEVSLRIHTHVREDTLSLFGFATKLELDLFERLIAISGVGPRLALSVLSGIEPPDLVRAIGNGDVARLTAIPGVGKKTAERIGLELRDKLPVAVGVDEPKEDAAPADGDLRADVLSALFNLGYHRPLAERAAAAALEGGDGSFERTLRQALRELARS